MVNIPPLGKTLEEPTPLPQERQKRKRTKVPINSLEIATDKNNHENYAPFILKIVLKVKKTKYRTSGKNPLLVEDVLMQQTQANMQLVQKKVAEIIPALLKFGSSL